MSETVDVFWSFRSPYSRLVTPDLLQLPTDYEVDVQLRVVLPLAVRDPGFFSPDNVKRGRYIGMDWVRRAQMLGMPHRWPSPDPIVQDLQTYRIAAEQPYIHRLTHLGVEAERRGHGLDFAFEVSHVIFGGTREWRLGDPLAHAPPQAGLNLAELDAAIANGDHLEEIERNQEALDAAGHWGVPTMVFRGEPFFGQDRIDTLRWRLDQQPGLRRG